jgi:DNA invertase Pin-like site-specific DNA recombinase
VNGAVKVTGSHRSRIALIYVRQSSLAQVRDHTEFTARQYALAETAAELGWPGGNVVVIDADLGVSGRSVTARSGFREVVARVCLGEIGAIFGLEMSRLARSSADFARLLELARLTDTLLVDADGVYDLADINDRLILGLKGNMSEVELHLLASRLNGAKQAAARRGDLRTQLPVGYLYDQDKAVVIDPDQEVQAAVGDVFAAFAATGSAFKVVEVFAGRRFPYRVHGGPFHDQLRWGVLNHGRVLSMLSNPTYAGAYAYGRCRSAQHVDPDGTVRTVLQHLRRPDWPILIKDHHGGYVTWEQFEQAEVRLAANTTRRGARPAREGSALCQGTIACGSCGSPARTRYHWAKPSSPAYFCAESAEAHQLKTPTCRTVRAAALTTRWSRSCSPRSPRPRSRSPWPPRGKWPGGPRVPAGPPSSPSNGPATTPTGPSGRSRPANRRTAWSPGLWRAGGRTSSRFWPTPGRHWPPSAPQRRSHRTPQL